VPQLDQVRSQSLIIAVFFTLQLEHSTRKVLQQRLILDDVGIEESEKVLVVWKRRPNASIFHDLGQV